MPPSRGHAGWGLIEPLYYDGKKGRKPKPLDTMLRMYLPL